jgi:TonB family protein
MKMKLLLGIVCVSFAAAAQEVVPPQPIETPAAVAPPGATAGATVGLLVTVGADGTVKDAAVDVSGGPDFDAAALDAVKKWRFRPALRGGVPFAARVRIPFRFVPAAAPPAAPGLPGTSSASRQAEAGGLGAPPPQAGAPDAGVPTEAAAPEAGPAAVATVLDAGVPEAVAPAPGQGGAIGEVSVRGRQRKVDRGGSDFQIDIGQLSIIPRKNAEELLNLAPGIFLANEGGEGHAEQVFLRGFNADKGQSIEFTVNGVPINEVDNPDGHGYADTHFIIPELIKELQVIEGPFDPHQGNFAVAGSARYELGVRERGLRISGTAGSYGTRRYLALWAPKGQREGTFAAVEYGTTDGFGVSRAASHATAMAEFEGELGTRGLYRILATAYATHYSSAGVMRKDDVASGRKGFYETEDPSQGGDAQRYTLSFDLESPTGDGVVTQQAFLTWRTLRITENFTGYLLDTQGTTQSVHGQRGDAAQKDYSALTAGARGGYRVRFKLFDRDQAIEAGYFARYDHTRPQEQRLRFGTQIPYLIDQDFQTDIFNLAGYLDAELRPFSFLTLRGGLRQEFFDYNILDNCQTAGAPYKPGAALDVNCPFYDRAGPRQPTRRQTATGQFLAPKLTALVALPLDLTLTASAGLGGQSIDARYISQDQQSPIVKLRAGEAGLIYRRQFEEMALTARAVGYYTHVDQDLLWDPNSGRLAASPGTTRIGVVGALRATGRFFDEAASVTTVDPRFDDTHSLVPYTPLVVARSDTALFGPIPGNWHLFDQLLLGEAGLAVSYLGKRSLPFSQFADPTLQIDASLTLRAGPVKAGVVVTNLTNKQFPLSQFFYTSDFKTRDYPTLAPAAHFTAAPPRIVLFTLEIALEREH